MLFQEIQIAMAEILEALFFCSMADISPPITQVCQRHLSFISFFLINLISNYESPSHLTDKTISSGLQASQTYKGFGK